MNRQSLKALVAVRLRHLMDTHPNLDTQAKVAARAHISQASVARILSQQQAATVDSLESIAHAFDIHAYELLMPEPQDAALARGLARLRPDDKQRILSYIEIAAGLPLWQTMPSQRTTELSGAVPPQLAAANQQAPSKAPPPGTHAKHAP
jgi:transcriptional regulator with XRE-family HTH domain